MSNTKMQSWRDIMGSKYFTARNLSDEWDQEVTIQKVEVREIDEGEPKILLHFEGWDRPLIMNISNCHFTSEALQTENPMLWKGKKILLYKDVAEYEGRESDAVRVRPYDASSNSDNNGEAHADMLVEFESTGRSIYKQDWDQKKVKGIQDYMLRKINVEGITDPKKLSIKELKELTERMMDKATNPKPEDQ